MKCPHERIEKCPLYVESHRLRESIAMAANRLESALLGDEPCKHCVELALSYLVLEQTARETDG